MCRLRVPRRRFGGSRHYGTGGLFYYNNYRTNSKMFSISTRVPGGLHTYRKTSGRRAGPSEGPLQERRRREVTLHVPRRAAVTQRREGLIQRKHWSNHCCKRELKTNAPVGLHSAELKSDVF